MSLFALALSIQSVLVVVENVTEDVLACILFFSLVALRQHSVERIHYQESARMA